jgi:uncharacterized protein (DUF58 family)
VKLTKRGKDFLAAILAGVVFATVIDIKMVLALSFSLVAVALISKLVLAKASEENIAINPSADHISCFKGEEGKIDLEIRPSVNRFVTASLTKVIPPQGAEAKIVQSDPTVSSLIIRPKYAGRFSGISAEFELVDPLQLFKKKVDYTSKDLTIDCYPSSLLKEIRAVKPISVALGEREGSTHGAGLEFYSLEDYRGSSERKNIFWKKVASRPDERLLMKIREANIPRTLTICLIRTGPRSSDSLRWVDSACEGVGLIGKIILEMGCDVEILFDNGKVVGIETSSLRELSKAVMEMSAYQQSNLDNASLLLARADICVTGFRELENLLFASAVARKPSLLIEDDDAKPARIGELAVIYGPDKDLSSLVYRVVGL